MDDTGNEIELKQISGAANALREATSLSKEFGRSISAAFVKGAVDGKRMESVLQGLGRRLQEMALKAAFKPLENALALGFDVLTKAVSSGFSPVTPNASGNVISRGLVTPFADGGVVAAPTYFPLARGLGLMGEAGAEAIMPLKRGPDGKLGVAAQGAGQRPVNISVSITAQDVESFRRSEAQVAAALARAVARGQRAS